MTIVFENARVLTMNKDREVLYDVNVTVEGNIISKISKERPVISGARYIDCSEKLLMPGLINGHCHASMSFFRNFGNDVSLKTWLEDYIWPVEAYLTGEDIKKGARLDCLEMIQNGVTTFVDMYFEMDYVAQAVEELGNRAILTRGITKDSVDDAIEDQAEFFRKWNGAANDRIRVMVGSHAIYTNDERALLMEKDLADRLGTGINIHVSETRKEVEDAEKEYGMSPVQFLDKLGILDEKTIAAHCVWLSDRDIEILAKRRVNCVYNPASNMKLASGFMPLDKLLKSGVNVAIGTDGASSNNEQDLFRDMTLGSLIQKGKSLDPKAASALTMLELATINGAKAIGREDDLGSIEVGKKADIIAIDLNNINLKPYPEDIEAALVYSTSGKDVCLTMVDGRILYEDGVFALANKNIIIDEAEKAWKELIKRSGKDESRA